MDFYEIFQQILDEQGLGVADAARLCDLSDSTVRSIFSRKQKKIALEVAFKISEGLGVSLERLNGMEEPSPKSKVVPYKASLSEDTLQVAQDYSALDKAGQRAVKVLIADQQARVKEEKKKQRSKKYEDIFEGETTGRVIPHYFSPPAAGYASPIFDEDFEYIEVGGDVPPQADFAVDIQGDSMEPYIMDGSTVYVNRDPLANADVGIFFFDGAMLCKQYYKDEWGNVNLLSMNRERADADVFIEEDSDLTLVCYGRVILPHRLRLAVPENELL